MRGSVLMVWSIAAFTGVAAGQLGDRIAGPMAVSRSEVFAKNGVAATSQPLATQVAIEILKKGGTAVDAAIAANAVLGVVEPTGCGIGGDLFAIVWHNESQKLYGLNGSGRSPYGLTLDMLKSMGLSSIPAHGPLPVTVPGTVDGWFELHKRFGKLPMSVILAPAIRYANEGFPLSELIAFYWARGTRILQDQPNFSSTFSRERWEPKKGDIFKNPDLARTYESLARDGREAFYRGELTAIMVEFCKLEGCYLRERDFAEHSSTWVQPIATTYRGYEVWELPPNGQGMAVLQMLNLLEAYDLTSMGHNSGEYLHRLIEAKKIAFEDRARFYADPEFARVPVKELLSKGYADRRRELINPREALEEIDPGDPKLAEGDTIYLTVADKHRNMVSLIQSNYRGFGSGMVPDGLGFVFQDRGELFSLDERHPNVYAAHKRPFHTIIPGFATKGGKPWLSFGVMGGDMQPQGHVQVLCNLIDFGMNLQQAGDAARFHHQGSTEPTDPAVIVETEPRPLGAGEATKPPSYEATKAGTEARPLGSSENISPQTPDHQITKLPNAQDRMRDGGFVAVESGISPATLRDLVRRGHDVRFESDGYGGYQAILYDAARDVYVGASDFRKDGHAAGY